MKRFVSLLLILVCSLFIVYCEDEEPVIEEHVPTELELMLDDLDLDLYLDVEHYMAVARPGNWTDYFFYKEDCQCIYGEDFFISVRDLGSENVMFYMEGGGAVWPGGGGATPFPIGGNDLGYKNLSEDNPLHDWNIVYVPYCDGSIHSGDNDMEFDGEMHHFWGRKNTMAGVKIMTQLFPDPEKILVCGASAGGFGTFLGWPMVKYQYLDTDTYIFNDAGPGFWNPDDEETFDVIRDAWQFDDLIPDECDNCGGTVLTYLYDLYMEYDSQVRIGMFSSYYDSTIGRGFLDMTNEGFKEVLLSVTGEILEENPDRFGRFFVEGEDHTALLFPEGLKYEVDGISIYDWIGEIVTDDISLTDALE